MRRGHLDGLVDVRALEDVESADHLLGLGERPVADQHLAVPHRDRLGLARGPEPVAIQPDAARDHVIEPGKTPAFLGVPRLLVGLEASAVDTDQHHVLHRLLRSSLGVHNTTTNKHRAKDSPPRAGTPASRPTDRGPAACVRRVRAMPGQPMALTADAATVPRTASTALIAATASPRKGRRSRASRASISAATPKTGGTASQNTTSEATAPTPRTRAVQAEARADSRRRARRTTSPKMRTVRATTIAARMRPTRQAGPLLVSRAMRTAVRIALSSTARPAERRTLGVRVRVVSTEVVVIGMVLSS